MISLISLRKYILLLFLIIGAVLFFSLIVFLGIKMPEIKGRAGENKVSSILNRLPKEKYIVIDDLLLKTTRGTSQIDHVVLSEFGIFVIETKNYSGWIYGGENSEEWIKNVYGNKYNFRNPLKQNYAHVKALMEILKITNQNVFIPIVAFSNQADIKVQSSKNILNFGDIKRCILSYQSPILNIDILRDYEAKLSSYKDYTKDAKKEHVTEIKNETQQREIKIKKGICPRCGGQLVKRKGKNGSFWGCRNYPGCRFTQN